MTTSPDPTLPQTPAQWAVRWHGIVLLGALSFAVPVAHLGWHGLLGRSEPIIATRSQLPAPALTADTFADGSWMLAKEKQLREDTPLSWWLRGNWNELRYHAGVPQSPLVHFGRDGWFFIKESVQPDRAAWDRAAPARRAFLQEVQQLVARSGAELFMVVVPDKARVYPEYCYGDAGMPEQKRGNYAAILAELGELGIPTVDLAAAMAAARAAEPAVELYYRRDTHWRPQGALAAGRTVAAALEQRYAALLGDRLPMELSGMTSVRLVGDLPANMGILTVELPDAQMERRTMPMSLLADRLAETRDYYGLNLRTPGGTVAMDGKDPAARVLWIGTSFSEENGANAAALFLGRPLRTVIARGAVGMKPLRLALDELRAGTAAKVVVWELVERGMFDPVWREPKL
jgi:SGNH hydrolase-like domain, acetyltransferase AlgX